MNLGIIGVAILLGTAAVTYNGLKDEDFLNRYAFNVQSVLKHRKYERLITSGFLHVSWLHFGFNMLTLYCFGPVLEAALGAAHFALLYGSSLVGGGLFSLFIHRHNSSYQSVGASGALSGLIFAAIGLFPGIEVGLPLVELYMPGWLYGLIYVSISILGMRNQQGNIGHAAHLGGGLSGLVVAVTLRPMVLHVNYIPILCIVIPSVAFIALLLRRPNLLLANRPFEVQRGLHSQDDLHNIIKRRRQQDLDALLDKINSSGLESLNKREKAELEKLTK